MISRSNDCRSRLYLMAGFITPCCRVPVMLQITNGSGDAFCAGCLRDAAPLGRAQRQVIWQGWKWAAAEGEGGGKDVQRLEGWRGMAWRALEPLARSLFWLAIRLSRGRVVN